MDIRRARIGKVTDSGVFRARDDSVDAESHVDAELVARRAVKKGRYDRLLSPGVVEFAEEDIGASVASGAGKRLRAVVRRADHNCVAFNRDTFPELVLIYAIAGDKLLLLGPISVTVADEDVGCACICSFRIVVKRGADHRRVAADGDAISEHVSG